MARRPREAVERELEFPCVLSLSHRLVSRSSSPLRCSVFASLFASVARLTLRLLPIYGSPLHDCPLTRAPWLLAFNLPIVLSFAFSSLRPATLCVCQAFVNSVPSPLHAMRHRGIRLPFFMG